MQSAPDVMRVAPPASEDPVQMPRSERIGRKWQVSDEALWNPFEVISFTLWIVFGFGFLLGRSHYVFVAKLFLPVILIAVVVLVGQAVLRRRAGEAGVLKVMRVRMGLV